MSYVQAPNNYVVFIERRDWSASGCRVTHIYGPFSTHESAVNFVVLLHKKQPPEVYIGIRELFDPNPIIYDFGQGKDKV